MPLVICSGWSVNAFKNPVLFFSRYNRAMKASEDVGVTLYETSAWIAYDRCETHRCACSTTIPVIRCVGMSDVSMSTVKICDVTDMRPPFL